MERTQRRPRVSISTRMRTTDALHAWALTTWIPSARPRRFWWDHPLNREKSPNMVGSSLVAIPSSSQLRAGGDSNDENNLNPRDTENTENPEGTPFASYV